MLVEGAAACVQEVLVHTARQREPHRRPQQSGRRAVGKRIVITAAVAEQHPLDRRQVCRRIITRCWVASAIRGIGGAQAAGDVREPRAPEKVCAADGGGLRADEGRAHRLVRCTRQAQRRRE